LFTGDDDNAEHQMRHHFPVATHPYLAAAVAILEMRIEPLHQGLPMNFDIGGFFAATPNSDMKIIGVEACYAILAGGIAEPVVSVRAAATRLSGVT
jgi:hypothetical protein